MIKIAVVEDDKKYRGQLVEFLDRFSKEKEYAIEITEFTDGDEIIEKYSAKYDIILMDIQMEFMDGIKAAQHIRKLDTQVVIIFITSTAQFAIKGYEVDALDYVLKPISYFQFSQRLNRAIDRMKKREDQYIAINIKGETKKCRISDIYYLESQGHTIIFHTRDGELTTYGTMKNMEDDLSRYHFFRGNKGYLINLEHVEGIKDGCAVVADEMLVISRAKKNAFMAALSNYWGEAVK